MAPDRCNPSQPDSALVETRERYALFSQKIDFTTPLGSSKNKG